MPTNARLLSFLFVLASTSAPVIQAQAEDPDAERHLLWQIGVADDDYGELALAPDGYARFGEDAFFVVGESDPARDWPYVHPGPADHWAGARTHAFSVFFGLESVGEGPCRLIVDLVNTHDRTPPMLSIAVNDWRARHATPAGGPDASIYGDSTAGKEHVFSIDVPPEAFRVGLNELRIENATGSWMLYDWLGFEAPESVRPAPPRATRLRSARVEPWLVRHEGKPKQAVTVELLHIGTPARIVVEATDAERVEREVRSGASSVLLHFAPPETETLTSIVLREGERVVDSRDVLRRPAREGEPADWVDPLLGTATSRWMLYPGPSMPFSMVKLSPDNQRQCWKAGYEYTIENIAGISHLHSWTMGGLLTMPTTGELKIAPGPENDPDAGYRSRFRHDLESASCGYYSVMLDDYGVRAELTSTTRAGFQRYTFPPAKEARILFDLLTPTEYGYDVLDAHVRKVSDTAIEGWVKERGRGWAPYQEFTLHFVARLDRPFASMGSWIGEEIRRDVEELSGADDVGVFLELDMEDGGAVRLQTGISLVSVEQARLNLDTEMKPFGWDFDAVREHQRDVWNELLGKVEVEGGRPVDHGRFYTNLYRSYCSRTIWSDVNGAYVDMNEEVQRLDDPESPVYGCDAFWNTFWNLNQLWVLVTPDVASKWVRSLLEIDERGGWLPKGPTGIEYSSIMVASHEIALIVAAWQAGIRDFDLAHAWRAMKHVQTEPGRPHEGGGHVGNRQLAPYLEHGYVPVEDGPVSNTLEYAYDDWCVAQMAKALGLEEDHRAFLERAAYYRNVFDPTVGYSRERHRDGKWVEDFSPFRGNGFVEGNPWQFTWFAPHDVRGVIDLMGIAEFVRRLNQGLEDSVDNDFNATGDRMAAFPINHGNQPNMQSAYLFNHAGVPWLTQKWAREIMERYYGAGPIDGWPGDEDQGQMGAWFAMSAMGLFQMDGGCMVDPIYELGSPLFDRVVIHLDPRYYPGETFVIEAKNNSPENVYVQAAVLDGVALTKPWFRQSRLVDGGTLVLRMGPEPNPEWGAGLENAPPSMSTPDGE